jgi:hypothetical protein
VPRGIGPTAPPKDHTSDARQAPPPPRSSSHAGHLQEGGLLRPAQGPLRAATVLVDLHRARQGQARRPRPRGTLRRRQALGNDEDDPAWKVGHLADGQARARANQLIAEYGNERVRHRVRAAKHRLPARARAMHQRLGQTGTPSRRRRRRARFAQSTWAANHAMWQLTSQDQAHITCAAKPTRRRPLRSRSRDRRSTAMAHGVMKEGAQALGCGSRVARPCMGCRRRHSPLSATYAWLPTQLLQQAQPPLTS